MRICKFVLFTKDDQLLPFLFNVTPVTRVLSSSVLSG